MAGAVEAGCRAVGPSRRAAKRGSGLHRFAGEQCVNESCPVDPGGRHNPRGPPPAVIARGSHSVGEQCWRLCKKAQSVALLGERGPRSLGSRSCPPCGQVPQAWDSYLVDPASSHMLVSKTKPCMSKYKRFYTVKLRMAH